MNQHPYHHTGLDTRDEANARMLRENATPRCVHQHDWRGPRIRFADRLVFWACVLMFVVLWIGGWI